MFCVLFLRGGRITWTASPPQASASVLSLLFFELSGYYVSAVWLHVNAADVLVRRGVTGRLQITACMSAVIAGWLAGIVQNWSFGVLPVVADRADLTAHVKRWEHRAV
jgi:hypothetical protein